ncbi:hypothetical protein GEMRC1_011458 [Eukaryota sp. GEM-RC1]
MNAVCIYNWTWALSIGWILWILYLIASFLFCFTVIGLYYVEKIWHLSHYVLMPFNKEIIIDESTDRSSTEYIIISVVWVPFGGILLILAHAALGIAFLASVILIPFGAENMRMLNVVSVPFAAKWRYLSSEELEHIELWPNIPR